MIGRSPLMLAVVFAAMAASAVGAFVWNLSPLRRPPTARRLARFIEERVPGLDDRLATAVDLIDARASSAAAGVGRPIDADLAGPLLADTASHVRGIDVDAILPAALIRRTGVRAAGAGAVLL